MHYQSPIPFQDARIHAAAVYCSDGRFGAQMDDFLFNHLALPRYDRLSIPGGAAAIAAQPDPGAEGQAALDHIRFLVEAHELNRVILIAHAGCAYYILRRGLSPDQLRPAQLDDLARAADRIQQAHTRPLQIEAFFARVTDARVSFEPIALPGGTGS